jgi:antitoxin Phd
MQTISATQAKQNFADLLDRVQREPWLIQRHDRDVAVLISARDFESLLQALAALKQSRSSAEA